MSCHYFQHCTEEQPVQSHKEKITKDIILIEKKEAKLPFFGRLYDSLSREKCWEPAGGPPPVAKVMTKEARHMQRRDRASGVSLEILEHLPP